MGDRLAGRTALITGAGSGIGLATALRFAAEGAAVAVLDVRAQAATETAARITAADGRSIAVCADVADAAGVDAAIGRVAAELGPIDVLVNNAGIFGVPAGVAEAVEADWDRCMAVNVKGVYLCSRAALRHLDPDRGPAAIVNIASVAGLVAVGHAAAYCASKGAVIALTRAMAVDLAPRVRVNAICPGTVYTPLSEPLLALRGGGDLATGVTLTVPKYPLGRLGAPAEIANAALFLASDEASFLTGSILAADGGMSAA